MKKTAFLSLAWLAIASSFSAQAADEIALQRGQSTVTWRYGSSQNFGWEAQVANLGPVKSVYAHVKNIDGQWIDVPLQYHSSSGAGKEIWKGYWFAHGNWDAEYALKYEVNGRTYWDNNQGRNYRQGADTGSLLRDGLNVLNRYEPVVRASWDNQLHGSVTVRNLGPAKNVAVVYSTDGWRTSQVVQAYYNPAYWNSGYSAAPNPNAYGAEEWTYQLPLGEASRLELAVSYTVNGQTFWDNNQGQNYSVRIERESTR